jgi:phage-related protein
MTPDSFTFGSVNCLDEWGIRVISWDTFGPPKRTRKRQIPFRQGQYDYGAKYYNERNLDIDCVLTKEINKSETRDIIELLRRKNTIHLWDEPDKYYIGEIYDSPQITVLPKQIARNFTLRFICEPFAYGQQRSIFLVNGVNAISYSGTAETPTLIIIKNLSDMTVNGLYINVMSEH